MARTGVYFSDVKKARDQLVAQGRRPSIDAIRAALGDTGSKTTIHKYMRELEAEETGENSTVSDTVLALVNQLSSQLKQEADVQINVVRDAMAAQQAAHEKDVAALREQLAGASTSMATLTQALAAIRADAAALSAQLHQEQVARSTAEQRSADLGERLADAHQHQASLEDKHRTARDALEHFRAAAKEQREQELRRHGQQLQAAQVELRQAQQTAALKQEELTRLNREAAALVAELAAGKQAAFLDRETNRHLARQITRLQAAESRVAVLDAQLAESRLRIAALDDAAVRASAAADALQRQKAELEADLAQARMTSALEERLAKLDEAVFGSGPDRPSPAAA